MHHNDVANAAILDHSNDNADLVHHCNAFLSLFSVYGLPSFKEHLFQKTPFSGCFKIYHILYGKQYTGISTMIALMEKGWFYERLCFNMMIVIFFSKLGFTPCKAEQSLQDMELQEKEAQND